MRLPRLNQALTKPFRDSLFHDKLPTMPADTVRFHQIVLFVLIGAVFSGHLAAQDESAAKSAADSVLAMYDAGEYGRMYDSVFHESMKQTATRDQWIAAAKQLARQTGKATGRSVAKQTKSMGIYRIIFNTQCTEGKVYEDISLTKDSADWKVVGFFIKPNLE